VRACQLRRRLHSAGVETCDDGNDEDTDACPTSCESATCGDGFVHLGQENCDDGNNVSMDGCSGDCQISECANPNGGPLSAENGTNMGVNYCYGPNDSTQVRAQKACESHFGAGQCCIKANGYQGQQYGQCNADGGQGTLHWHWDNHPDGHCGPMYVIGDVVSPGWCGVIIGNFMD
jgi:cysteine-rich repeat protein